MNLQFIYCDTIKFCSNVVNTKSFRFVHNSSFFRNGRSQYGSSTIPILKELEISKRESRRSSKSPQLDHLCVYRCSGQSHPASTFGLSHSLLSAKNLTSGQVRRPIPLTPLSRLTCLQVQCPGLQKALAVILCISNK